MPKSYVNQPDSEPGNDIMLEEEDFRPIDSQNFSTGAKLIGSVDHKTESATNE